MASSKDYLEYVLGLLREVESVTYKKMMGEYILYKEDILFGGVYDNRFLIKKTKSLENSGLKEQMPYPSAKSMLLIDSEDPDGSFITVTTNGETPALTFTINNKSISSTPITITIPIPWSLGGCPSH